MLSHVKTLLIISLCICATGCATSYTSSGLLGGYTSTDLGPDKFKINFSGNGFTTKERAEDFALLRAADLTVERGFRYFKVLARTDNSTSYTSTTNSYAVTNVKNNGWGKAKATTDFYGGDSYTYNYPNISFEIRAFPASRMPEDDNSYDAQFVRNSLRMKYNIK